MDTEAVSAHTWHQRPAFNEAVPVCGQNRACSPDFALMALQGGSEALLQRLLAHLTGKWAKIATRNQVDGMAHFDGPPSNGESLLHPKDGLQ